MRIVSAEEMRDLDRLTIEGGTPGHVLMERAGNGATKVLLDLFPHMRRKGRRALICAGKGNNGGDGFVMARLLRNRGARTDVVLFGRADEVKGDAARNLRSYRRGRTVIHEVTGTEELDALVDCLQRADVIIDAIFGTGLSSEVRGVQAAAIDLINTAGVPVFAVDIPSGLHADTGLPLGTAIQAEATATFGFAKIGQVLYPGATNCGELAVVDIGISSPATAARPPTTWLLDRDEAARLVPARRPDAHKGDCGHLLVVAGSFGKTGAAQLVTRAALRVGAGLVTLVGPSSLYPVYASGVLEAMTEVLPDRDGRILFDAQRLEELAAGKSAVVIGPGIGTHEEARQVVGWLLGNLSVPLVLDADALTCVADDISSLSATKAPTVLTPHPGEMARLLGADTPGVQADRVGVARRFAASHRCVLILKGARTVVAEPSSHAWINPTGNPGMASGGMGDVLCGVVGGLVAQGLTAAEAARLGVYLHGASADRAAMEGGEIGLVASDVIAGLRPGLCDLQRHLGV
jgi:NAD(P)H-hydrate epimerase